MSDAITLSPEGQITIPESVRQAQGWRAGQGFVLLPNGESMVLVPVPTLEELRGIAAGADTSDYRDRDDRYRWGWSIPPLGSSGWREVRHPKG